LQKEESALIFIRRSNDHVRSVACYRRLFYESIRNDDARTISARAF